MKKHIVITGSTDGIGKLAAQQLAAAGHVVYVHGRSREKLNHTIAEIKAATGNQEVGGFVADLSDLSAVVKLAAEIEQSLPQLDVLINNAGVFNSPVEHTHGTDIRFVVNYFAPYLLSQHLQELLKKSPGARLINLGSAAQATVQLEALKGHATIDTRAAYAQSKLALTMWSFALAKSLDNPAVITVNPGSLLNTRMVKEAFGHHWSPATKGADILFELATAEAVPGHSGKYFDNDKGDWGPAHEDAYNESKTNALLEATELFLKGLIN